MTTQHRIILGNSQQMPELENSAVQLMITSPPYPMIKMWDPLFEKADTRIEDLMKKLEIDSKEETVREIYDAMHDYLGKVWLETFRVLTDGGIACINIGDATRRLNGKFRLFANHARTVEICEKIGFTTLPYILWKKPTTKPKYKGKGAFLGSGFLPTNAYVTIDCEFILVFRKGNIRKFQPHDPQRYDSKFTKRQRDEWFSQIWNLKGSRQTASELERRTAAYPDEIPDRLIQMFSIKGDTVLDPFLGSGTTTKLAIKNERNSVGYETDARIIPVLTSKIGESTEKCNNVEIIERQYY